MSPRPASPDGASRTAPPRTSGTTPDLPSSVLGSPAAALRLGAGRWPPLLGLALALVAAPGAGPAPSLSAQEPPSPRIRGPATSRDRPGGEGLERRRQFYFTRGVYTSYGLGRGGRSPFGFRGRSWSTDFPKADRQFLTVIGRTLELLDLHDAENAVRLDDPDLRRFPFLYMLEVGYMSMTDAEVEGLRDYLLAGGFLVVDDFWGSREWANFEQEMGRVFPGRAIVELSTDHPIFHSFYDVEEVLQVPNAGAAQWGGPTHERDGFVPHVRGIFDDDGRLMAVINWNTDLGDAWEWSEQPFYPFRYSTYAYKMGVNFIVYAMTH